MINVFIIDDHPAVIEGLSFLLSDEDSEIQVTGSAINMTQATELLPNLDVQVIILDLFMGKDSPLNNLNLLKNICPDAAIMIYSAEDSIQWKYRMFQSGVNAYLGKCEPVEHIPEIIVKIADGSVYHTPDEEKDLEAWSGMELASGFSALEINIGQKVANGLALKEIALQTGKSVSSVEKILYRLRHKVNAHSNPDLIRILLQRNLILSSEAKCNCPPLSS